MEPGEGGLLVVCVTRFPPDRLLQPEPDVFASRPGSHKSSFDRAAEAHGPYGGRQEVLGSIVPRDSPQATAVPEGCVNVTPVKAGTAVIITEATLHGVLPYTGAAGRRRHMIAVGFEPQCECSNAPARLCSASDADRCCMAWQTRAPCRRRSRGWSG